MDDTPAENQAPSARAPLARIKPPRTIDIACVALIVQALAWIATAVAYGATTSGLTDYAYKHATRSISYCEKTSKDCTAAEVERDTALVFSRATKDGALCRAVSNSCTAAEVKKDTAKAFDDAPKSRDYCRAVSATCDAATVKSDKAYLADQIDKTQSSVLTQGIILALAFLLLAVMLRKPRGASPARWSVVIVSVLTQAPLMLLTASSGLPVGIVVVQFFVGVSSVVAIAVLFLRPSRQYFKDIRESLIDSLPPREPRSGGLFGSRRSTTTTTTTTRTTTTTNAAKAPARAAKPQDEVSLTKHATPDAKRKSDAAAVAKGAALARSRAKAAAKSRRSED